jgi:DNA repair protein RadC
MISKTERNTINSAIQILERELSLPETYITCPEDAAQYLVLKLAEAQREIFAVLLLNAQHGVIEYAELFFGTIDSASVHPREVVKAALKANAAAVVFAHNHPSGVAEPSQADQRITQRLKSALDLIDVRSLDHIIVAGTNTYRFSEHGLL